MKERVAYAERNLELVLRFQAGDVAAGGALIVQNEGLLRRILKQLVTTQLERKYRENLMQAARGGILVAAKTFDPAKAGFTTWICWQVRPLIQRYLCEMSMPVTISHDVFAAAFFGDKQAIPITPALINAARFALYAHRIENTPIGANGYGESWGGALHHAIHEDDLLLREPEAILASLEELDPREQEIVRRRFLCADPESPLGWSMSRARSDA